MEQHSYSVSSTSDPILRVSDANSNADYFPKFGSGTRTCIGKHISLLEINKVIPQLLRQFDFSGADDREWKTENRWFVKPSYSCRVSVRKSAAATA
jgi:cytochrome P450